MIESLKDELIFVEIQQITVRSNYNWCIYINLILNRSLTYYNLYGKQGGALYLNDFDRAIFRTIAGPITFWPYNLE